MPDDVLVRKGTRKEVDGYSAFYDNGRFVCVCVGGGEGGYGRACVRQVYGCEPAA